MKKTQFLKTHVFIYSELTNPFSFFMLFIKVKKLKNTN